MIKVVVRLFATLRNIVGKKRIDISLEENATVQDLLNEMMNKYRALEDALLSEGKLRPYIKILLNGRDIDFLQGLKTSLNERDEVAIFPPVGGG